MSNRRWIAWLRKKTWSLSLETWLTAWELIRITVPVAIVTKILEDYGLITFLGTGLEPVMNLLGLPGSLGLVWATAILTNIYGGIAVFTVLAPGLLLTSCQVTVLCSALLFAHSLPVELSVSKRAGAGLLFIGLLRLLSGAVYGFLLNRACLGLDIWQDKSVLLFTTSTNQTDLLQWVLTLLRNQGLIILIIFCIVLSMRVFRVLGFLQLLERMLAPILPRFGMGRGAAPTTVVGMIMGVGYGGALIIREAKSGKMSGSEVLNSMILLGLCHGLVEDTLVMAAIGGKFAGILWGRIIFSLIVTSLLVKLLALAANKRAKHQPERF